MMDDTTMHVSDEATEQINDGRDEFDDERLTGLEREVLREYVRLRRNLDSVSHPPLSSALSIVFPPHTFHRPSISSSLPTPLSLLPPARRYNAN